MGSERGEGSGLSSKFAVPSEAEPVLSQSDLRYSVFLSLVGKTVRFLKAGKGVYLSLSQPHPSQDLALHGHVVNVSAAELSPVQWCL